jgi:hypothetical protein
MVRFLTFDLFVIASSIAGCAVAAKAWKDSQAKKARIEAYFVGGPLHDTKRNIESGPSYIYRHSSLPAPALYKNTGNHIYEFVDYVEEGDSNG